MAQPYQNYQSNAPLGQAQASPLRAPGVGVSLPDGIDSSALYASLQSISSGLNDAMAIRKQKADEMSDALDRLKAMSDAAGKAFDDLYKMDKANAGSINGMPSLDSRFKGPRRVNQEMSGMMERLNAKTDAITKAAIESGALNNPKEMAIFEQELRKAINEGRVEAMGNQDYIKYKRALEAYQAVQDHIKAEQLKGKVIHPKYADYLNRMQAYLDEEPGAMITEQDLDPTQYIFDRDEIFDRLNKDFTKRFQATSRSEIVDINGNKQERIITTTPTVDDAIADIMETYGNDPDLDGAYEWMRTMGYQGSKEDYLRAYAGAFVLGDQDSFGKNLYKVPRPTSTTNKDDSDSNKTSPTGYEPRSYAYYFNTAIKSDEEAEWLKDISDYVSKSATGITEGKAVANAIAKMGFDPRSGTNLDGLIEKYGNDIGKIKFQYDAKTDRLYVGTYSENEWGDPTDFNIEAEFTEKFTDFETNDLITRIDKDLNSRYLPQEVRNLPTEYRTRANRYVEDSSELDRLGRLGQALTLLRRGNLKEDKWNRLNLGIGNYTAFPLKAKGKNDIDREKRLVQRIESIINNAERGNISATSPSTTTTQSPPTTGEDDFDDFFN